MGQFEKKAPRSLFAGYVVIISLYLEKRTRKKTDPKLLYQPGLKAGAKCDRTLTFSLDSLADSGFVRCDALAIFHNGYASFLDFGLVSH